MEKQYRGSASMFSFNIVSRKLHQMFCCPLYHRGLKACKLPVTHFLLSWFLVTVFQGEALQVGRLEEGRRRFSLHDSGSGRLQYAAACIPGLKQYCRSQSGLEGGCGYGSSSPRKSDSSDVGSHSNKNDSAQLS